MPKNEPSRALSPPTLERRFHSIARLIAPPTQQTALARMVAYINTGSLGPTQFFTLTTTAPTLALKGTPCGFG